MWFKKINARTFKSTNIILYLSYLGLVTIYFNKYVCAESNVLSTENVSTNKPGKISLSSSEKLSKTRGRRTRKPRTSRLKRAKFPKVAVFQADGVFWPYKVETDVAGPFALKRKDVLPVEMEENNMKTPLQVKIIHDYECEHEISDNNGKIIKPYTGIKAILETIRKKRSKIALAETTTEGATVLHLIQLCGFDKFNFKEVDDDPEIEHIKRIQTRAEVEFKDMVYFGTNETSLQKIQNLGVITVKINLGEGLKTHHIEQAEKSYATVKQ